MRCVHLLRLGRLVELFLFLNSIEREHRIESNKKSTEFFEFSYAFNALYCILCFVKEEEKKNVLHEMNCLSGFVCLLCIYVLR